MSRAGRGWLYLVDIRSSINTKDSFQIRTEQDAIQGFISVKQSKLIQRHFRSLSLSYVPGVVHRDQIEILVCFRVGTRWGNRRTATAPYRPRSTHSWSSWQRQLPRTGSEPSCRSIPSSKAPITSRSLLYISTTMRASSRSAHVVAPIHVQLLPVYRIAARNWVCRERRYPLPFFRIQSHRKEI